MRVGVALLLAVVAAWVQVYFFGSWRPFAVVPNLLLVVVMLAGLSLRASDAILLAVAGGLLIDLASGADFGLRMAFFSLQALLVILLGRLGADFDNLGILMLMVLVATPIYALAVIANVVLGGGAINWLVVLGRVALEAVANLVLLLMLRPLFNRWFNRSNIPQVKLGSW